MTTQALPTIPVVVLPQILLLKEKLSSHVLQPYDGKQLVGDAFNDFVSVVHTAMPKVPYSTLFKSIQHLAGTLITPDIVEELAARLAGNQQYLRKGIVIPPYTRQLFPEWAAVQVWNVERKLRVGYLGDKKDNNKVYKRKVEVELRVLTGQAAGHNFKQTWPESSFFHRKTKAKLGFSSCDKRLWNRYFVGENNYPLSDIRQLVKLRFFVYMDPEKSKAGEAFYEEMDCTDAMRKWNRALMKRRERQNFQCPKGYDLSLVPCHTCEVGFDLCLAGCHSVTYIKKSCPRCKQIANFANHEAEWCVDCVAKTS
jgi:phage FluMu protein Com